MKITVVGIDCVGLSSAMLLSQTHEVISLDAILEMIETVNIRVLINFCLSVNTVTQ